MRDASKKQLLRTSRPCLGRPNTFAIAIIPGSVARRRNSAMSVPSPPLATSVSERARSGALTAAMYATAPPIDEPTR